MAALVACKPTPKMRLRPLTEEAVMLLVLSHRRAARTLRTALPVAAVATAVRGRRLRRQTRSCSDITERTAL
eukprot:3583314-Lingulodinium_polyedra.AAC.1